LKIVDATVLFENSPAMHGIKKVEIKLLENFSRDPTIMFVNLSSPGSPAYVPRAHVLELLANGSKGIAEKEQPHRHEGQTTEIRKSRLSTTKTILIRRVRASLSNSPRSLRIGVTIPLGLALFIYRGLKRIWHSITSTLRDFLDFVNRETINSHPTAETQPPETEGYVSVIPLKAPENLGVLASLSKDDTFFSAGILWTRLDLSYLARRKRLNGFRVYSIVYDIIPLKFPHFGYAPHLEFYNKYFSDVIQLSDTVVTYSENNIKDIREYASKRLFLHDVDIKLVNLGFDDFLDFHSTYDPIEWLSGRQFIIYVSTIERRKNHEVLYRAYEIAIEAGIADKLPTLLLVGSPGWGVENLVNDISRDPTLVDSNGRRLIVFLGNTTQGNLNWLYKNAHFSVYPSLYEGWGMPVTESLMMGTHVLASDADALKESGLGLASHIPAKDARAWLEAIMSLSVKPKINVPQTGDPASWSDMARTISNLMEI
jgi:glycosyltransferase involved in cell wall biosynthesis